MLITSLSIRGFRSIRELTMENMGRAVILYGQNGAGKSNILAALGVLFRALGELASRSGPIHAEGAVEVPGILSVDDFMLNGDRALSVSVRLESPRSDLADVLPLKIAALRGLELAISALLPPVGAPRLWISQIAGIRHGRGDSIDLSQLMHVPMHPDKADLSTLQRQLGRQLQDDEIARFRNQLQSYLVLNVAKGVLRSIADLRRSDVKDEKSRDSADIQGMLTAGDVRGAFVTAHQHPRPEVRDRFVRLQNLLTRPPLSLRPFDAVRTGKGEPDIQARVLGGGAVPLNLAGLGTHQLLYILSSIVLEPVDIVTLEEPEAHLHAPTSGRALRRLLVQLLDERLVNQLFIATHSNLFDLDPEGYWHVERGEQGTTVERRTDLASIDRDHLYEPGPAKHALEDVLRLIPQAVVARMPNGDPITGEEMIRMLQADTDEAMEYCQSVVRAAVRLVRTQDAGKA